jgi:multidrug efflux pump subunit AcrA (membrane-fusion protein)
MDIVRPNKKKSLSKKIKITMSLSIVITLILFISFNKSSASHQVNKDSLLIDTVQRGELNITVRGTGVLVPKDIRWIAINVPGRVERVLNKAGAKVKKGDLLLELSNPQLNSYRTVCLLKIYSLAASQEYTDQV